MLIRIRWKTTQGPNIPGYHTLALAFAALLTPAALVAFTMAFWSIASELHWTVEFAISNGILSHWQIWLGASAFMLMLARLFNRYGVVETVAAQRQNERPLAS